MCTVTFIPSKDKIFITSNRDEKAWRKQALSPQFYIQNGYQLLYPKDAEKGGTWIALNENGNAAVLLNGAFVKHTPDNRYTKSRGLIFIEIIKNENPLKSFNQLNLASTEPFTIIIYADEKLYECRWDGYKKYHTEKDKDNTHIWSSATLYSNEIIDKRRNWFNVWMQKNTTPSVDDILHFHLFGGEGDIHNDLRMNRDGHVFTVSVTSMEIGKSFATMRYLDMKDETKHNQIISINKKLES